MAWSENRKKAMEELGRGRELANQLRDLLTKSLRDEGLNPSRSRSSEDLVKKIFYSFANTLSILRNDDDDNNNNNDNNIGDYEDEVPQQNIYMSWERDGRKSDNLAESIKSTSTTTTTTTSTSTRKDRRRKHVESWTRDTPTLFDDGHVWRKYGQKVILHANHPRNYYRCTHNSDQGCQATKQVQQIEDDPPKYRTTYYGHHTCRNLLKAASQPFLDSSSIDDSSILLSFADNNQLTNKDDNKGEHMPSDITSCCNRSALSEHLLSPDHLPMFEPSAQMTVLSADQQTDVISGVVDFEDLDYLLEFEGYVG